MDTAFAILFDTFSYLCHITPSQSTRNDNPNEKGMKALKLIILLAMAATVVSCSDVTPTARLRSAYYWSTTLNADSATTAFINAHAIGRLYVRYFDVVMSADGRPQPNATLRFATPMPSGVEIVPTVFVTPQCMHADRARLAALIVKRVLQIGTTHNVKGVKEIQVDCDWTSSTRRAYSDFMSHMLRECHARHLRLSATIRLHQLAQTPPPADRGVLMVYNTGDVTTPSDRNPILDMRDVAPYLSHLASYKLPLAAAYPMFSWRVLYRGGRFVGIVHRRDEYPMLPGDSLALQRASVGEVLRAERAVSRRRRDTAAETVIYDISDNNLKQFKHQDYEKVYNCH